MKILITGAAGFIGFHLVKKLLSARHSVIGLDNLNNYYDIQLKYDRLSQLGISKCKVDKKKVSDVFKNFSFYLTDIENMLQINNIFNIEKPDIVVHLAAQAGVRYSLLKPDAYIQTNIVGFFNILESCKVNKVKHLIFASSSSVYGNSKKVPFSVEDNVDHPVSLYAATKKSNELMAYTYSHLYGIPVTGLRFFTVYGPWGRPDMAYFSFTKNILEGKPISVFNHGKLSRDFTYIDDIVNGLEKVINKDKNHQFSIYNIGNNKPVELIKFIHTIEKITGNQAVMEMKDMQPGDVFTTYADIDNFIKDFNYAPSTSIEDGMKNFINWYRIYFNI